MPSPIVKTILSTGIYIVQDKDYEGLTERGPLAFGIVIQNFGGGELFQVGDYVTYAASEDRLFDDADGLTYRIVLLAEMFFKMAPLV